MRTIAAFLLAAFIAIGIPIAAGAQSTLDFLGPTTVRLHHKVHYGISTSHVVMAITHQSCWNHLFRMSNYLEGSVKPGRHIEMPPSQGQPAPPLVVPTPSARYSISFDLEATQLGTCSIEVLEGSESRTLHLTVVP